MLLDQKTKELYGYEPSDLTIKSSKLICLSCDYCGIEFDSTPKRRLSAHSVIKTDSCQKCKYVKMD